MQNRWKVFLVVSLILLTASAGLTGSYQHAYIWRSSQFVLSRLKKILFSGLTQVGEETQALEQESTKVDVETQELEQKPERELEEVKGPWLDVWPAIFIPLPREINQVTYYQHVENFSITYSVPPSRTEILDDEYGNCYLALYWFEQQTRNATVTIEVFISRKVGMNPVNPSDPYPIPKNQLPENFSTYLQPSKYIQSDDSTIVALAQNLSQGLTKQIDVVNNTLEWISKNVKWRCYREAMEEHGKYGDAVSTLKYKEGVCVHFARLMAALFRAQGIPARIAKGIPHEKGNPGYLLRPVNVIIFHKWVEIYYPTVGWIRYDPTRFSAPHVTYGIQLTAYPSSGSTAYPAVISHWPKYHSPFKATSGALEIKGIEENRVKLTYTIKLIPEEQPEG